MTESEHERRQREAAQRIIKGIMPDLDRLMKNLVSLNPPKRTIGELFTSQHQEMLGELMKTPVLKIDFRAFDLPPLKLDYKSLFPDFTSVHADVFKSLRPSIKIIQDVQREQFADVIAKARAAVMASLPPNWRGDDLTIPQNLETMLLDEGLPLAWVPPHTVVLALFAAATPAYRRKILGNRWKSIARSCGVELEDIEKAELAEHVEFALEAAEALLDGKARSSQALSANLLDSILRASFSTQDRKTITGQKARLDIEDYPMRVAIVLGGIWGSHGEYWPNKGDKIPRSFSRHGSAHGVSRRQYSRINALLALMHVVGLLRVIEADLS